jgi:hypothetical protein
MKKQRERADDILPDPSLIDDYICLATSTSDHSATNMLGVYEEHAKQCLIAIYKSQKKRVKAGDLKGIDERIVKFVREELHRCAAQSDPLGAVEALVTNPRSRGRPRTPFRDYDIARDVAKLIAAGHSVDGACHEISDQRTDHMSFEQVRRIYKKKKVNKIRIMITVPGWQAKKSPVAK